MRKSLTKWERLRSRREIERLFKFGQTATGKGMRLAYLRKEAGPSRFVVIPRRGHKNAVERNRCKRIGKEVFRSVKDGVLAGYDIAIVCFPGDYRYADRHEQLLQLLSNANLLCGKPTEKI